MYEDVFAEVVTTNRSDENVDLSTTYLGKIGMKREDIMLHNAMLLARPNWTIKSI